MMNSRWEWQDLDSLNPEIRNKTLPAIHNFVLNHPDAAMDHDLEWLYAKCGKEKSVRVFVCLASDGALIGYAPFFVHPSALSFELFGISLFDYRIHRYTITSGPLIAPNHVSQEIFRDLFIKLLDNLDNRDALFGLGIEQFSNFYQFIHLNLDLKKKYQIFPSGNTYKRRFIILPNSFDEYVKKLGYNARKDVRKALRNLENDSELTASYRVFTAPDEVPEFLALAQLVSEKTYQKALFDFGISNNPETCRILTLAAEKGWLRSYILTSKGEPVALRHGYLYHETYYAEQTGYDPRWSKWSVGTSIYALAIRDLIHIGATKLDFLYGDNEKKKSLSNSFREEQNYYFIPRRFPLSAIAYGLRLFNFITQLLGVFMEKYKLKSQIHRFLRKRVKTQSAD